MPWNLLVLPLLGGYSLLKFTHYFRFRHQRLEGYRFLMDSALCGVSLFIAARLFVWVAFKFEAGQCLAAVLSRLASFPFVGTAVGAFLLGFVFPMIGNLVYRKPRASLRAIKDLDDALLWLLTEAAEQRISPDQAQSGRGIVLVTLETRKVYAAYVAQAPNLETGGDVYVKLAPMRSGYRDESDLTIHFTEYYEDYYRDLYKEQNKEMHLKGDGKPDDLAVVVPMSRIVSVQPFDLKLYDETVAAPDDEKASDPLPLGTW